MKLTNEIRKQIVDAAIAKSKVPKMREHVLQGRRALALKAYQAAVAVPSEIANLPYSVSAAWVRRVSTIFVYADGFSRYDNFDSRPDTARGLLPVELKLEDPVVVPLHFNQVMAKEHPAVAKAAAKLHADHLAANEYEDTLRQKLSAIVASANTVEQLLRTWPEGKPFVPAPKTPVRALVDTKTVAEINETLGLKAVKAKP